MKTRSVNLILLDTSFILTVLKNHQELVEEIRKVVAGPVRVATTDGVVMELQRLSRKSRFSTAGLAKTALRALEGNKLEVLESSPAIPEVDTSILLIALTEKERALVATVDGRLSDLLVKHNIGVVTLRGRKGLVVSRGQAHPLLKK